MSTRMRDAMFGRLRELRYEPTERRVRAAIGDRTVVDSVRAMLVWEPRRVVPVYAVPEEDVDAALAPANITLAVSESPILHPGIPFAVHSTAGEPLDVRVSGQTREAAAFRPDDEDLAGYVVLDFGAFDRWLEEDEPVVTHPRDPYHRVDARRSSRTVRLELDGKLLAESRRPTLVFETSLPTRFYLPREDVVADLEPTDTRTYCPYKGEASYWSVRGRRDLAWTYADPLPDAVALAGLIAFYDDRVDVTLDGAPRERPDTTISRALLEEFGVDDRSAP